MTFLFLAGGVGTGQSFEGAARNVGDAVEVMERQVGFQHGFSAQADDDAPVGNGAETLCIGGLCGISPAQVGVFCQPGVDMAGSVELFEPVSLAFILFVVALLEDLYRDIFIQDESQVFTAPDALFAEQSGGGRREVIEPVHCASPSPSGAFNSASAKRRSQVPKAIHSVVALR